MYKYKYKYKKYKYVQIQIITLHIIIITCRSLVEQQKRKLAQLEEIEKEAAEKEPSRWFSNSFSFIMVLNLNSN